MMELIEQRSLSFSLLIGSHQPDLEVKLARVVFARLVRFDFDRERKLSKNEPRLSQECLHDGSSNLVDGSPEGAEEGSDGS